MKKCKCCNLYIDEKSRFCPYCGEKIQKSVHKVELAAVTEKLTVKTEVYKYKGEERNRYVFYTSRQDKISSFTPEVPSEIEDAWLVGEDRIFFVTSRQGNVYLSTIGINKKASKEICVLPSGHQRNSRTLYTIEDGRLLLRGNRYVHGEWQTDVCLINGNDVCTFSVEENVFNVELYSDDTIVCNQGLGEVYLLTSDGTVHTASSLYDKEELLRRYHMQCIETDRFCYPEIIWDSPFIKCQTLDWSCGEVHVTLRCGKYREGDPEDEYYEHSPLKYRHEDTLIVEPDRNLPIGKMQPVVMEASEWEQEAADIRYMEKLTKIDHPEWKEHHRLCAFCKLGNDILYGTGEQEQFVYYGKQRSVFFFPPRQFKDGEELLDFAIEYASKHPEHALFAQRVEQMHLLDSVTEKLIRTHETRLQPFFEYMKDAWQYDSMVKGETGFRKITYSIRDFLDAVDMVIGVCFTDTSGKGKIGWKEQEFMYTEQATGMLVRMNTPYGKKVVDIPLRTEPLSMVLMTDDQPAADRSEWYAALNGKWKRYQQKEIPNVPVPYRTINVCSDAINRVEMSQYHLYSDNYRLPDRSRKTSADLMYSPDGYKLNPDESIGSFYYRIDDNVKVAVDDLTDIHLYALSRDGIFFIRNHQLYFRGQNNESRNYGGKYFDSVRLNVSEHYIFIDCVDTYIQGDSYDACGDTMYITEFSVKYRTDVVSRTTGELVAVWKDMPEITQLYQWSDQTITVATGETWYHIADSDEGIRSLSAIWDRPKKGKQVLTKDHMGEKAYALMEQHGIHNFVGSMNGGKIRMVVDGAYKDFS